MMGLTTVLHKCLFSLVSQISTMLVISPYLIAE